LRTSQATKTKPVKGQTQWKGSSACQEKVPKKTTGSGKVAIGGMCKGEELISCMVQRRAMWRPGPSPVHKKNKGRKEWIPRSPTKEFL